MKIKLLLLVWIILIFHSCSQTTEEKKFQLSGSNQITEGQIFTISKETLKDKIKGGWAGQAIGVTYGGPTEFRFTGTIIQDYTPISWYKGYMKEWFENAPGLYDDIYMDLTFVDIFEKYGLNAPVDSFAMAFAKAKYPLWHANQAARYNILNGIMPPQSGYWINNPHADCIDFQIEADFAGLMSPGMVNSASEICDKIGHIMNHGDGWYGGVYVAALYSLAFYSDNIEFIVNEALKTIPQQSTFYQCIADVIKWCNEYPDDWKRTWFEVEKKWSEDVGCPDGVFKAFNIDAKVNAAYIVIGLLYGQGDFGKTIDISTRCGQDSDCNPASAGGVLGTKIGYGKIPEKWKVPLYEVEDVDFKYTTISLNDVYEMGYKHAIQMIEKNEGLIEGNNLKIKLQAPKAVKFEQNFEGHYPVERRRIPEKNKIIEDTIEFTFEFTGIGFVIRGNSYNNNSDTPSDFKNISELFIDDQLVETVKLPAFFTTRRYDLFWKYNLPKQKHVVRIKLKDPKNKCGLWLNDILIYSDSPNKIENI